VAVADRDLTDWAEEGTRVEGIDFSPEGGAAIAAAVELKRTGFIGPSDQVVLFNTGAGWLYR
jgi:threonine synthase